MSVKDGLLDMLEETAVSLLKSGNDSRLPAVVSVKPEQMLEIVAELKRARGMARTMRHWRALGSEAPMTADELLRALCDGLDR